MAPPPQDIGPGAWKIIQTAKALAQAERASLLMPRHLFQACVVEQTDLAVQTLKQLRLGESKVETLLGAVVPAAPTGPAEDVHATIRMSPEAMQLIQRAREQAARAASQAERQLQPSHLWASACAEDSGLADWLRGCNWPEAIIELLPQVSSAGRAGSGAFLSVEEAAILDRYCSRNLSRLAERGAIDGAHGMEEVRRQIVNVLLKRNKRSVVLTGPAGVGKTKLVEDLSVAILRGDVPDLAGCLVYELDLVQFTRGTHLVGSQQERFAELTGVLNAHAERVILFIDELHMVVGVSMGSEAMNLANALKPLLANGTLRIVGATTSDEYRRYIEGDPALARRFTEVKVSEPDREGTLAILRNAAPAYEAHHRVQYSEEALREIYDMASLYFPNLSFPAKGIDLLDEVGVHVRVRDRAPAPVGSPPIVGASDVRETFGRVWGIEPDASNVDLGALLRERVIGQDAAAERLADLVAVSRFRTATDSRGRPRLAVLLVGPPGVGKSHMARCLAEILFPGRDTLLTIDMTEFSGPHGGEKAAFRLVGAPPPYVGWERGGLLTTHALQHPHSVVLVDEIEKAETEARSVFLRILNDGSVQDGRGRLVSFRGMYFVFTTNAAADLWTDRPRQRIGYPNRDTELRGREPRLGDEAIREALRRDGFAPEFLSRISQLVLFQQLDDPDFAAVMASETRRLSDQLLCDETILLEYDEDVLCRWLVERMPAPRDCRRAQATVEEHVETPLARWQLRRADRNPIVLRLAPEGDRVAIVEETNRATVEALLLSRVHEVFNRHEARRRQERTARALLGAGA